MTSSNKEHWRTIRWIFKYLRGSSDVCLRFRTTRDGFIRYVDSDFVGDLDKRRYLTGYMFIIGGCAIN